MPNELKPLISDHKSLAELAHEAIQEMILSGDFKPGDWLRQEDLSKQLSVSHTPVRQALDRLVSDGLAEHIPHRGVRVAAINEDEIAENYCLRLMLEPLVVRLTTLHITDNQLKQLEMIIGQAERLTLLEGMSSRRQLNRKFHRMISEICGSTTLNRMHEIMWNRFPDWMLYEGLHRQRYTLKPRLQREIEEHRALLDALRMKNIDLAVELSKQHIIGTKDDLIEIFEISNEYIEEKRQQWGK